MKMEEFYNKIKSFPPVHLHVQPDGCEGLLGPETVHQGLAVGLPDLQLGLAVVPAQTGVLLSRTADNNNLTTHFLTAGAAAAGCWVGGAAAAAGFLAASLSALLAALSASIWASTFAFAAFSSCKDELYIML